MYSAIARNKRNTWFILGGFVVVLGLVGLAAGWLAGNNWWITAFILVFAAGYATVQYFFADKEALALSGAVQVSQAEAPRFSRLVENLCITTGTPMPKLYVVDDPAPNAFATGRKPVFGLVVAVAAATTSRRSSSSCSVSSRRSWPRSWPAPCRPLFRASASISPMRPAR